jgi:hypothetical protein
LGKRLPCLDDRVRDMQEMNRRLREQQYLEMLKNDAINNARRDWGESKLYDMYVKNGRFREHDPEIYSETEIKYYITMLRKLSEKKYNADGDEQAK